MKRFYLAFLFVSVSVAAPSPAADKEKLEEGSYGRLQKGSTVQEHSWILWKAPNGNTELEVQFQAYKPPSDPYSNLLATSPVLDEAIHNDIYPTSLSAVFNPAGQLLSVKVEGVTAYGRNYEGLSCKTDKGSMECKGVDNKATLRSDEMTGLFWWFRVPELLRSWRCPGPGAASTVSKIAYLHLEKRDFKRDPYLNRREFEPQPDPGIMGWITHWGTRPVLDSADLNMANEGKENLVLGDRSFNAEKCRIDIKPKRFGGQMSLTEWTDAKGTVLAVRDSIEPNKPVALLQFKRYSAPPPSAPASK